MSNPITEAVGKELNRLDAYNECPDHDQQLKWNGTNDANNLGWQCARGSTNTKNITPGLELPNYENTKASNVCISTAHGTKGLYWVASGKKRDALTSGSRRCHGYEAFDLEHQGSEKKTFKIKNRATGKYVRCYDDDGDMINPLNFQNTGSEFKIYRTWRPGKEKDQNNYDVSGEYGTDKVYAIACVRPKYKGYNRLTNEPEATHYLEVSQNTNDSSNFLNVKFGQEFGITYRTFNPFHPTARDEGNQNTRPDRWTGMFHITSAVPSTDPTAAANASLSQWTTHANFTEGEYYIRDSKKTNAKGWSVGGNNFLELSGTGESKFTIEKKKREGEERLYHMKVNNQYVACEPQTDGKFKLRANRGNTGAWEELYISSHKDGFSIRCSSHHKGNYEVEYGAFVRADDNNTLVHDSYTAGDAVWHLVSASTVNSTNSIPAGPTK